MNQQSQDYSEYSYNETNSIEEEQSQTYLSYYSQSQFSDSQNHLISINVQIFKDLGYQLDQRHFRLSIENRRRSQHRQPESEYQIASSQNTSQVQVSSYGDDSMNDEIENEEQPSQTYIQYSYSQFQPQQNYISNINSLEEQNQQSPIFIVRDKKQGMTKDQIQSLPIMKWTNNHQLINKGQKCSVCLEEYAIGNEIRVMQCLHRYHLACVDQWLTLRASCPVCRNSLV